MNSFKFSALVALAVVAGCRTPDGASDVKVTNGVEIAEAQEPSVVRVENAAGKACTGTFVTRQVVVTAAHCVYRKFFLYKGRAPAHVYTLATELLDQSNVAEPWYDAAVVDFGADVAPAVSALSLRDLKVGDALTLVGYGTNDDIAATGAGPKRLGHNTVGQLAGPTTPCGRGQIYFEGLPQDSTVVPRGQGSLGGFGDSGGPGFVDDDKLAVVDSNGVDTQATQAVLTGTGKNFECMVDLRSPDSQRLLGCVAAAGTAIPGVPPAADAASCAGLDKLAVIQAMPDLGPEPPHGSVTYASTIAPFLARSCTSCHGTGGTSPDLSSYDGAVSAAYWSLDLIERGQMPPKPASVQPMDAVRFASWVTGGTPK